MYVVLVFFITIAPTLNNLILMVLQVAFSNLVPQNAVDLMLSIRVYAKEDKISLN